MRRCQMDKGDPRGYCTETGRNGLPQSGQGATLKETEEERKGAEEDEGMVNEKNKGQQKSAPTRVRAPSQMLEQILQLP